MEQFLSFLEFDGYGQFIWSAYGLSALVLIGILFQSLRFQKRTETELIALQNGAEATDEESANVKAQA